jgi:hypothetical protein
MTNDEDLYETPLAKVFYIDVNNVDCINFGNDLTIWNAEYYPFNSTERSSPNSRPGRLCLGCLLTELVPGSGFLCARQYGWAAAYFLVGAPFTAWAAYEVFKNTGDRPYREPNLTPVYVFLSLKAVESVHVFFAIVDYADKCDARARSALLRKEPLYSTDWHSRAAPTAEKDIELSIPIGPSSLGIGLRMRL